MRLKLLALAASAMMATTAHATIYTQTFSGTVTGVDTLGYFGTAGAEIDSTYVETFTIDTSLGTFSSNGLGAESDGGSGYGDSDPVTGAVSINGATLLVTSLTGNFGYSIIEPDPSGAIQDSSVASIMGQPVLLGGAVFADGPAGFPPDFGAPYYVRINNTNEYQEPVQNTLTVYSSDFQSYIEELQLTPEVATNISAAPEPSVWALMLAGVGLIRIALRRRSSLAVA